MSGTAASPVAVTAVKSTVSARKLDQLHRWLSQLTRERRHKVFSSKFSQGQRLVLEHWLLNRKHRHVSTEKLQTVPVKRAAPPGNEHSQRSETPSRACLLAESESLADRVSVSTGKTSPTARTRGVFNRRSHAPIGVAVHRRTYGTFYSAVVACESLEFRSRPVRDLKLASNFRTALVRAKDAVSGLLASMVASETPGDWNEFVVLVRDGIKSALDVFQLHAEKDVGLYLRVNNACRWFGTTICGPVFKLETSSRSTADFASGLRGWHDFRTTLKYTNAGLETGDPDGKLSLLVQKVYLDLWGAGAKTYENKHKLDVMASRLDLRRRKMSAERKHRIALACARQVAQEIDRARLTNKRADDIEAKILRLLQVWSLRCAD